MRLKTSPKNSKLSPIRPPSKVPEKYPPTTQILKQPSSQCIPSSQRVICSWAAACTRSIGQRVSSGSIHNVIVLVQPRHNLIRNNALLVIGKETMSTVSNDFKVSLLSDNPLLNLPVKLLESFFRHREASGIWGLRLTIIIRFLPDKVDHILGWRWEDIIQRMVAAATTHRCLRTICAVGLLATINDAKSVGLLNFIAAFTHPAAALLSKIGVTFRAYGPPSPLGSSRQPQSSRIFQLGTGRPAIAVFTIDKMVVAMIDVIIGSINSSSPGQCHENSWVLFSPSLFPPMSRST